MIVFGLGVTVGCLLGVGLMLGFDWYLQSPLFA